MKKYLALFVAPLSSFDKALKMPQEEMKPWMDEWSAWMRSNKSSFADEGAPVGKTKRVSAEGVSDIRNNVGGYAIVEADSLDDAAKILKDSPHFRISEGAVEVMEFVPMPGA